MESRQRSQTSRDVAPLPHDACWEGRSRTAALDTHLIRERILALSEAAAASGRLSTVVHFHPPSLLHPSRMLLLGSAYWRRC